MGSSWELPGLHAADHCLPGTAATTVAPPTPHPSKKGRQRVSRESDTHTGRYLTRQSELLEQIHKHWQVLYQKVTTTKQYSKRCL